MSQTQVEFYAGLCDLQIKVTEFASAEVQRLKLENARLRKQIEETPSSLSAMQDEIVMLRKLLQKETP